MAKKAKLKLSDIIERCQKQKMISTHLITDKLITLDKEHQQLHNDYKDLQHRYNKHAQLMKQEIKRLKEKNRKLVSENEQNRA